MTMVKRRYTVLADNSPLQHKIGFFIEPHNAQYFDPNTFIASVDFAKLLKDVEYWQSAKFTFCVTGVGVWYNNFIEYEIDVISNVYSDIKNLPGYLLNEIDTWAKFLHVKDIVIRRMLISFSI